MKHVIFSKMEFKVSFIKSRSIIRWVQKADDIMSDDIIADYMIRKNEEMTILVYVSHFKG